MGLNIILLANETIQMEVSIRKPCDMQDNWTVLSHNSVMSPDSIFQQWLTHLHFVENMQCWS